MNRMVEERLEGKEWLNREVDMIEELTRDFSITADWHIADCGCDHTIHGIAHYNWVEDNLCFSSNEIASMPMVVLHEAAHYLNKVVNPRTHGTLGGHNREWREIFRTLAKEWNLGAVFEDFESRNLIDGYDDEEHFIEMLLHPAYKTGTYEYNRLASTVRKPARRLSGMSL